MEQIHPNTVDKVHNYQLDCKNMLLNMDPEFNPHILDIFTPKMLSYLPMYNISYSSLAQYIIYLDTTELNIRCHFDAIKHHFHSRQYVINLWQSPSLSIYDWSIHNNKSKSFFKPKQKMFSDDELKERRKEQMKIARNKYIDKHKNDVEHIEHIEHDKLLARIRAKSIYDTKKNNK